MFSAVCLGFFFFNLVDSSFFLIHSNIHDFKSVLLTPMKEWPLFRHFLVSSQEPSTFAHPDSSTSAHK